MVMIDIIKREAKAKGSMEKLHGNHVKTSWKEMNRTYFEDHGAFLSCAV